ncbi:hypothetical protein BKA80DRAFT_283788 [Phyllosticta citrichinensis]
MLPTAKPQHHGRRASERLDIARLPTRNARPRTPSSSGTPFPQLVLRMVRRPPAKQN